MKIQKTKLKQKFKVGDIVTPSSEVEKIIYNGRFHKQLFKVTSVYKSKKDQDDFFLYFLDYFSNSMGETAFLNQCDLKKYTWWEKIKYQFIIKHYV